MLHRGHQQGRRGKLTWAARAWVSGGLLRGDGRGRNEPALEDAVEDAIRFGLPPETIADLASSLNAHHVGVWPRNVAIVRAFLATASQWRTALRPTRSGPRLVYIGLDYSGVRTGLDALAVDVTPELWAGLTIMEDAARDALNGA